MRRSILAVALCASTLVLVAGRCSGDDDTASTPAPAAGEDAASIEPVPPLEPADPNAKEPDEMFKDPLAVPEGVPAADSGGALEELGDAPLPGDETFLDDPSFEPEAPVEGAPATPEP